MKSLFFCCSRIEKRIDTIYGVIYNVIGVRVLSQWEKLLSRIKSLSKELRYAELKKVLEAYGYEEHGPKGGSSHHTFRKKGHAPITIPKHEPIKRVYVEMVRDIVLSEEGYDENIG